MVVQSIVVGIGVGGDDVFIKFLFGGFYGESTITISEFNYLYFEVWAKCKEWFICMLPKCIIYWV